jgi:N-methylhydantoinase B
MGEGFEEMKKNIDAVTVEIIGNLLSSIAEEMGITLVKSAYSTNIKERRDISTAIFDPDGNMVSQAEHVAMHLGSLLGIIHEIYRKNAIEDIKPGDMFIGNDPYNGGGTHLPDITVAAPVFVEERLIGWVANLAHHSDVGGKVAGSTSGDAISIFQEGLKIPLVRLCSNGTLNTDIADFLATNSRLPVEREGDLQAQIAANYVGIRQLKNAFDRWDEKLIESMSESQDYAERRLRAGIAKLTDGIYEFEDFMDDGGIASPDPIRIHVSINIAGDTMNLDFNGTDSQVSGPINVTRNGLLATTFYSLKALIDPDIPSNAGIYRAFTISARPGLIVNAENPAPVGARIDTCMRVADVIFGALAPAIPDRAMAGCNSSCTSAIFSMADTEGSGQFYVYLETIAGGSGAQRDRDGLSGVQVHMTNTSNLPIEALEMEFPLLLVRKYTLLADSGGAGKYRGGLGIERVYEAKYDGIFYTGLGDRQKFHPWGLNGGLSGTGGCYYITRKDGLIERLPSKCTDVILYKGDTVTVHTPGAGGYGNPLERDRQSVLIDVIEGRVSTKMAEKLYDVKVLTKGRNLILAQ